MLRCTSLTAGFVLLAALLFPFRLDAAEVDGVFFKESLTLGDTRLNLTGSGLFRYWGFNAYVGAFYLEEGYPIEEALSDRAKRIEIEYLRPIRGQDFGPATNKAISQNVALDIYTGLRSQIDYHNSLYEDVGPGDRYSLTYIPGIDTELALNEKSKGIIKGAEFAAAIFSIWLGPKPISESFKKQILGI